MDNPLHVSLVVSGIGMLVLFVALALLCGLMYLMTAFVKDRSEPKGRGTGDEEPEAEDRERGARARRQQVAAIAVALARAEADSKHPADSKRPLDLSLISAPGAEEIRGVSPWWAFHHQRRLMLNMPSRIPMVRGRVR